MNRAMIPAAVLLLALRASAFGKPDTELIDLTCFDDGTLVGQTSDLHLVTLKAGQWLPSPLAKTILRLWRSPDDRIFAISSDDAWSAVEIPHGGAPGGHWKLETSTGHLRFTSLNGADVVTPDHVYRLDPAGKLTTLGETPIGGSGRPLPRAPELLAAQGTTVVCTGTWVHHDDSVGGSCREANGAYVYLVDFGEPLCCADDVASFTAPFVCGDTVISAVRNKTQARALATGALLGRTAGAARQGSTCLDGKRALLVGKRDIQIVSVPRLRRLWREKDSTEIQSVAVCHGGTRAIILRKGMAYPVEEFDLASPAAFGKKEEDDGRMSRGP